MYDFRGCLAPKRTVGFLRGRSMRQSLVAVGVVPLLIVLGIVTVTPGSASAAGRSGRSPRRASHTISLSRSAKHSISTAGADPQGTIYVADYGDNAVDVFPPGSSGDVAPERQIEGADTGINGPGDVKVDAEGDVWVSNFSGASITEYAPEASGDASPICTITGTNTDLSSNDDMSLEADGTLVVGDVQDPNDEGGAVLVFAPSSCGDVAPVEEIVGSNTGFDLLDGVGTDAAGTIYADSSNGNSVQVFPAGANGNVAPESTISGSNTNLDYPDDVIVGFNGELYVTNQFYGLTVFAPGATGNATPTEAITGSNSDFGDPDDMAVDTSGNMFVTDSESAVGPALLEYASGATGNVAPVATITGSATTFVEPEGVAVAGPPITTSATLATSTASSIALGSQTQDTATLANGKSPTGDLVYKLFGPNDSTCSKAPAYVSSITVVKGDGTYTSPSFTPTEAGTYSWVDLYSGDSNNAPVTTACDDASETVTVGSSTGCPPTVSHVYKYGNSREETVKVVIVGTCLRGAISVHFGDTPADFVVSSDRSIRADPPPHSAGSVDVTVTTGAGTSPANPPHDQYTYFLPKIQEVTPHSGSTGGGAGVVIRGMGLEEPPASHSEVPRPVLRS
jgi:sugar lactone lactonase YvrE